MMADADADEVPPAASALINSLRSTGYDLESAVADIIDNSITAGATVIRVIMFDDGMQSWIAIQDNGKGMDQAKLVSAMRLGSQHPEILRDRNDLGRFGLGLKTASLSQCRRLSVITKEESSPVIVRAWDIDAIASTNKWLLFKQLSNKSLEKRFTDVLNDSRHGTVVLWQNLDRILQNNADSQAGNILQQHVRSLERHLSVTFHRYISEEKKLSIFIGEQKVPTWDPFLLSEKATQCLGEEIITYKASRISVKPFVLPHHSKVTPEVHRLASGPRLWNGQQGFYVYRNKRLLVGGSWLNLGFQQEEHHKLARIQVDFTNELDLDWDINIRKSRAVPPVALRADFQRIARRTRDSARGVYRHRGSIVARSLTKKVFLWEKVVQHGQISYRMNRDHPIVDALFATALGVSTKKRIADLIRVVEATLPVPLILIDGAENPTDINSGESDAAIDETISVFYALHAAMCENGVNKLSAFDVLSSTEPFYNFTNILDTHKAHLVGDP